MDAAMNIWQISPRDRPTMGNSFIMGVAAHRALHGVIDLLLIANDLPFGNTKKELWRKRLKAVGKTGNDVAQVLLWAAVFRDVTCGLKGEVRGAIRQKLIRNIRKKKYTVINQVTVEGSSLELKQ